MIAQKNIPLYDPEVPEYKKLFNIREIDANDNHYEDPISHRHSYYQVLFFKTGSGEHRIDNKVYPVADECIHFLAPHHAHLLNVHSETQGILITFRKEFLLMDSGGDFFKDLSFFQLNYDPVLKLAQVDRADYAVVAFYIGQMQEVIQRREKDTTFLLIALLKSLLYSLKRLYRSSLIDTNIAPSIELLNRFKELVNSNYKENWSIRKYADSLSIAPEYLNQIVRKYEGKPPSHLLRDRLLLEAKCLLIHTNNSIKEIAFELGFNDYSYFIRFFKKAIGIPPKKFRETF